MFDVEIKIDTSGLDQLVKDIQDAESKAAREVARSIVVPAMRQAVSFAGDSAPIGQLGTRTGRLRMQMKAKFWRGKDGLTNGSVKVIGDRAFIARFAETGTKRQPARKMFEIVGRNLRLAIERAMVASFERHMQAKGYR